MSLPIEIVFIAIRSATELNAALAASGVLDEGQLAELPLLVSQFPEVIDLARELVRRGWLTVYQLKQIFQGRAPDLVLGQYVVLDLLGEGGMGQVFKARHRRLDRVDALKVIRAQHLQQPDALRRFLREARAAARLSHLNIEGWHKGAVGEPGQDGATVAAAAVRPLLPLPWASVRASL